MLLFSNIILVIIFMSLHVHNRYQSLSLEIKWQQNSSEPSSVLQQFLSIWIFLHISTFSKFYQVFEKSRKGHNNNKHITVTFIHYYIDSCPILHFLSILLCHLPRQQNPLKKVFFFLMIFTYLVSKLLISLNITVTKNFYIFIL